MLQSDSKEDDERSLLHALKSGSSLQTSGSAIHNTGQRLDSYHLIRRVSKVKLALTERLIHPVAKARGGIGLINLLFGVHLRIGNDKNVDVYVKAV